MLRILPRAVAALTFVILTCADASAMYVVNASGGLNVRTGPGTNYSVIRTLANGTQVTVVQNSGDWRKISSPVTGWVNGAYLRPAPAASTPFVWPASGQIWGTYYDMRASGRHEAIDIVAPRGYNVGAARGGTVSRGYNAGGYGNYVRMTHEVGYTTVYAHLNSFAGGTGWVGSGAIIGYIGNTGNASSTDPHCHFEVQRYGTRLVVPASNGQWTTRGAAIPASYAGL